MDDADNGLAAVRRLADAGAGSVVLQPVHGTEEAQISLTGGMLLRALTAL